MSKYIIVAIIIIGIIVIWLFMGNMGEIETDNGSMDKNFMQIEGDASTGLPRFHYYHQHRGYKVRSPVMQPRYIEDELKRWYDNQQINGVQYQSALTQSRAWGFI